VAIRDTCGLIIACRLQHRSKSANDRGAFIQAALEGKSGGEKGERVKGIEPS
jgi:hypothetical protein